MLKPALKGVDINYLTGFAQEIKGQGIISLDSKKMYSYPS